ncbi:MAG: ATP-binding cassette domain-containing protein [Geminicoccaceae bacterium]
MTERQTLTRSAIEGLPLVAAGLRVSFGADAAPALDVDRLTIDPGDHVALVGPSGSGKTTLGYVLTGITRPDTGSVRWGTVDLAHLSEPSRDAWRRRCVGFVFQDFHLVPGMTPLGNVLLPCYFSALGPSPKEVERAHALLDLVGVSLSRPDVAALSRGEQQRVAIARALLNDPPIIVADEPTASLDEANAARVLDLLIGAAGHRTLIAITHDRQLIDRMRRVIRMERGRLVDAR